MRVGIVLIPVVLVVDEALEVAGSDRVVREFYVRREFEDTIRGGVVQRFAVELGS